MSAAHVPLSGPRRIIGLTPANTNEATMLTAGKENPIVTEIYITNITGVTANATVKWGDGTDYAILSAHAVANSVHLDVCIPLRATHTIKVTSGTGSALTFSLVVVEVGSAVSG